MGVSRRDTESPVSVVTSDMNTAAFCERPAPMARAGLSARSLAMDSGELWVVSGTST